MLAEKKAWTGSCDPGARYSHKRSIQERQELVPVYVGVYDGHRTPTHGTREPSFEILDWSRYLHFWSSHDGEPEWTIWDKSSEQQCEADLWQRRDV